MPGSTRGVHLDGIWQSVWRSVESRRSARGDRVDGVGRLRTISLADTVGMARPEQIRELIGAVHREVRLPRDWRAPAQPAGAGGRESARRLRRRLPAL